MEYGNFSSELVETTQKEAAHTARKVAGARGFSPEDREDLEQDLILAVLEKANTYDPARGAVKTFVASIIRSKLLMELRRRRRETARMKTIFSLDHDMDNGEETVPCHETLDHDLLMSRMGRGKADPLLLADLCHDVAISLKLLTPRQQRIAHLLARTDKATAAHRMGISRQTLYRELGAIKEAMGNVGLKSYVGAV